MSLPPGPRGPLATARLVRSFTRDPDATILAVSQEYGPVASMRFGRDVVVVVSDPELVGELLLDKEGAYIKDVVTRGLAEVLGRGLLTSEGEQWRRQRKLIAPSLGKGRIAGYAESMVEHTRGYVERLRQGEERDVHADMSKLTLDIVVATLFGAKLPGGVQERVAKIIDQYMHDFHALQHSWRSLFPAWFPFPERLRGGLLARELDALVMDVVKERRASAVRGDDLLSRLLAARDETTPDRGMDDRQLRDEVITLFTAGHETTSNALSWTLLLLAEHPEIDARLATEVREVLGGRSATPDDLASLPLARAVLDEAMRLYPPAHIIGREAKRDVRLGGWLLPKGTNVAVSPWAMHHDRRFFEDPEAFRPDRWLDGSTAALPRHVYLPFGGGPRVCVGNHFALMEGVLVLVTLVQRARFERISRAPVRAQPAITLRPVDGVPLRVALRDLRTSRPAEERAPARVA